MSAQATPSLASDLALAAADLQALRARLATLAACLPAHPEAARQDDPPDAPLSLRSRLECLLADHLDPALASLRAAASDLSSPVPQAPPGGGGNDG
jgi:hypothetical protein